MFPYLWVFSCNSLGLFLSGLIRASRLYPTLITLLRANIPFYFCPSRSHTHSLLLDWEKLKNVSLAFCCPLSALSFQIITFKVPLTAFYHCLLFWLLTSVALEKSRGGTIYHICTVISSFHLGYMS